MNIRPGPAPDALPLARLLDAAAARLRAAGIDAPRREARLLLASVLNLTPEQLLALAPATQIQTAVLEPALARRLAREPIDHILGHRGFWTLNLLVSPDTLIPRPDTETLIETVAALAAARTTSGRPIRRILDLGTGTGALLLAALNVCPDASGLGIDDEPACRLAAANARRHALSDRAAFIAADWTAPLAATPGFDLILSNPPYIETADIPRLAPEVSRHEPHRALDGGPDGLDAYRAILPTLPALLEPDGDIVLEIGAGQLAPLHPIAAQAGLAILHARPDLGGHPRAIHLRPTRHAA